MRIALWVAVLLAAFAAAWVVQARWTAAHRAEQDAAFGRVPIEAADLPEGFSRVVVGAPSGAEPVILPQPAAPVPPDRDAAPADEPPPPAPGERRHVVRKGESLSKICAAAYGTARADVIAAVARVNGLARPDQIREGQVLVLPPFEELKIPPR